MPPRIDIVSCIRAQARAACTPIASLRAFSSSSPAQASTVAQRRRRRSPYAEAQARSLKLANISRQKTLRAERAQYAGDPVRGVETVFLQSLDTARPIKVRPLRERAQGLDGLDQQPSSAEDVPLQYGITPADLDASIENSRQLSEPRSELERDPLLRKRREEEHETGHSNASEALQRILTMQLGGARDRHYANVQRLVDTFGRHTTDYTLRGRPSNDPDYVPPEDNVTERTLERAGPDTGSPEVQIAVLTARIRNLATHVEENRKDKHNKRKLREMVHKRQRLLLYLRRKERGGERWQYLIRTLGLSEATWKGEISL